ncbi:hypothetical protein Ndes2526B_g07220 [Nannochloris sp. 'desiccata']
MCFLACLFSTLVPHATAASLSSRHRARSLLQEVPIPDFYFPLTDNSLYSTTPAAEYQAIPSSGVDWIFDPTTGFTVLDCDRSRESYLTIPGVTYGQNGPFTVSFWVKPRLDGGQQMEYAFSHSSVEAAASGDSIAYEPNVIHLYYPQQDHPDGGVVRAIVRDNEDGAVTDPQFITYLDSQGCVADGACKPTTSESQAAAANVANQDSWHFITLTTQPDGTSKGLRLYVDGVFVSQLSSTEEYQDISGFLHPATGGGPLNLNGTLTLCARADLDSDRFFSGNLANLRVYNVPLEAEQVKALFDGDTAAGFVANNSSFSDSPPSLLPFQTTQPVVNLTAPSPPSFSDSTSSITAARIGGQPLCATEPVETVQQCSGEGYVCFPLSDVQIESALGGNAAEAGSGKLGVCAFAPEGVLLPSSSEVPAPMAFFPLNTPALESFPLREHKGVNKGATVAYDQIFGGALRCTADDFNIVALDPVRYGATTGAFTVNLWVRLGSDVDSPSLMYVYSHRGTDADSDQSGWGPNQVQLYFPQASHPAFGVARLYVRDSDDVYNETASTGYIDSDGQIASNVGPREPLFPLLDGNWHMLSMTSQPQGGPGYRMYVDGQLAADLNAGNVPPGLNVDGGDPMVLDGNIILCSRGDDPEERHVDADIAYLSMWDVALNATQVESLFSVVNQQIEKVGPLPPRDSESGTEAVSTRRPEIQRMSITGRPCIFPTVYKGQSIVDCVSSGDASRPTDEICPVADGEWETCEPLASKAVPTAGSITFYPSPPSMYDEYSEEMANFDEEISRASGTDMTQAFARGTMYSADGRLCQFPLRYGDITVNNCLSFGGDQFCWAVDNSVYSDVFGGTGSTSSIQGGEWAPCAAEALIQPPEPGTLGVGPSTVPVLQLQKVARVTTDGGICNFPMVVNGDIYDDCIQLPESVGGSSSEPSCLSSSGEWKTCNLKNVSPEYTTSTGGGGSATRPVYVAERTTVTGKNCIFPAAAGEYVWFDCAVVSAGQEGIEPFASGEQRVCPTADATWELCAPANTSGFTTKALDIPAALKERTVLGQLGQLCSISASSESSSTTPKKCDQGLSCIPMPRLVNSTAPENNPLYDAGFCATRPAGTTFGIFPVLQKVDAPQPVAFFPLTGGVLNALTLPEYSGTVLGNSNITWVSDTMFDTVPVCNRSAMNAIQLDNVAYGASGPFSVNLWMRRLPGTSDFQGDTFQYLYSHSGWSSTAGYSPNQVHLYIPEQSHPAHGTVRAIVKDSNDDPWDLGFLDSDGQIKSSEARTAAPEHGDINDGSWHMISLTTLPDNEGNGEGGSGAEGYVLYVDGIESGKISQPTPLADGSMAVPTGGDPALMSHDIFLCSRSDLGNSIDAARYYDGSLANLMLFDAALTAEQIQALYDAYNPGKYTLSGGEGEEVVLASEKSAEALEAKDAGEGGASSSDGGSGGLSGGEITGIVFAAIGATAALIAIGMLAVGALRNKRGGGGGGGGGGRGQGKFERFEENAFTAAAPVSPSYAERGYGFYPSSPMNNNNKQQQQQQRHDQCTSW